MCVCVCVCVCACVRACVCVCARWCIGYLSGLLTVPYQSSSYEPDRWDFKPEINLSMCMHECVCCILTAWKWINSAVNSTPSKILCMYDWLHVCARPRGEGGVWAGHGECVLVQLVFSKPFEVLNDLIPSRYHKSQISIPSPSQHYRAQCNSSPSPLLHARLEQPVAHEYALFIPSSLSYTHLCRCFLPLFSSSFSIIYTHIHLSAKSKPLTHTYVA